MSEVVLQPLRVDPDGGVFDLQAEPGLGAFEVAGQDRTDLGGDLAGGRIDVLDGRAELHGRAEDHANAEPEETVARPVRQRAAPVQPTLPRIPAGPDDHGRVGSHRYLTCVPTQGLATADFIWFYLQTSEGLGKVQSASPGSADRNRTLGQGALEAITVPTPPIGRQEWFDRLHAKSREARAIRASTAQEVEALIPAMLHETFGRQHQAA